MGEREEFRPDDTQTTSSDDDAGLGGRLMIHTAISRAKAFPVPRELVTAAARCWRSARDSGARAQQHLHALLAPVGGDMLAPVFDSLMTLYESALGRRIAVGKTKALSRDERLLLGLLEGTLPRRSCVRCTEGAAGALECAICSTRIMLRCARLDARRV